MSAIVWSYDTSGDFAYDYSVLTLDRPIGEWSGYLSFGSGIAANTAIEQHGACDTWGMRGAGSDSGRASVLVGLCSPP